MPIEIHNLEVLDAPGGTLAEPVTEGAPAARRADPGLDEEALERWYRDAVFRAARVSTD